MGWKLRDNSISDTEMRDVECLLLHAIFFRGQLWKVIACSRESVSTGTPMAYAAGPRIFTNLMVWVVLFGSLVSYIISICDSAQPFIAGTFLEKRTSVGLLEGCFGCQGLREVAFMFGFDMRCECMLDTGKIGECIFRSPCGDTRKESSLGYAPVAAGDIEVL